MATRLADEFPEVAALPREDLRELAEQHTPQQMAYFGAVFDSLPQVRSLYEEHTRLLEQVEAAAGTAAYVHAREMESAWTATERAMHEAYKRFTPSALQARIHHAANAVHDESEALANAYVEDLPPEGSTHTMNYALFSGLPTFGFPLSMSTQPLLQRTAGKRIALPVRVEPKVFFANERTFLSWLSFTVTLSALAVGLLNFGDRVGRVSAALFSFVAVAIMLYALVTYHWRANAIRNRGPTVLSVLLLTAIIVNFVLRFSE
ncbi:hypothetical protein MVES_000258 [Malassezia vespertilionis]|uniref:Uncharacterized protein n=1 Tax=Malassezia vespertilionis TaxID=2020962 RepID=A0A2N1JGR7_9BASI|nr:hypothetical protein MVES_000258 [Malassezia vespertilionis]